MRGEDKRGAIFPAAIQHCSERLESGSNKQDFQYVFMRKIKEISLARMKKFEELRTKKANKTEIPDDIFDKLDDSNSTIKPTTAKK